MKQLTERNTKTFNETLEKLKTELEALSNVAKDLSEESDAKAEHLARSVAAKIGSVKAYMNRELKKLKATQNNDQNESSIKELTKEINKLKAQQKKFLQEGKRQSKMLDNLKHQLESQESIHEAEISQLKEMVQMREFSFETEVKQLTAQVESQKVKITYLEGQLALQTRKSIQPQKDLKKNIPNVQTPLAEKTTNSINTLPKPTAKVSNVSNTVKHSKVAKPAKKPQCKKPKETPADKKNHHKTNVIVRF
ncbi:unnamed protein product [Ambrosiozyma monospora]|uniref:Unnamed protein product n=1 Tax=Ambrosiozyma monospora TaxID=43982 RepID=A0ACB5T4V6_AMBMO|nr:unnamed protein product [Ambrosiozyma monospora]